MKIRNATNGGIIIECATKNAIADLKIDAESILGDDYSVSIPEKRMPKVRVFGIAENMPSDVIRKRLLEQNSGIFNGNSVLNVFNVTKAVNSDRYWFKLECDPTTFTAVLSSGKLKIGWDICNVQEMFDVLRCFTCNAFGHRSKNCTSKPTCPKCSEDHEISDCTSTVPKCVNCVTANRDLNMQIDTCHFAWSSDCPVYKRQLDRQRKRIDYGTE